MMLALILGAAFLALVLAGFYAGSETAAYATKPVRLRYLEAQGNPAAAVSMRLLRDLPALVTTTLVGHNLAVYLGTFLLTRKFEESGMHDAEFYATLCLTPVCFIVGETLPKRLAHSLADAYLLASARSLRISALVFRPMGFVLGGIGSLLHGMLRRMGYETRPSTGRQRLAEYLEESAAEGILTPTQHRMAQRIMEIQDLTVREVMIPRAKAFAIAEDETAVEAARRMVRENHNRAPLLDRQGRLSTRFVTVNGILRNETMRESPVQELAYEALTMDGNTSLANALARLRENKARMAVVTGKNGKPVGVVTLSTLLSAVVGTLQL